MTNDKENGIITEQLKNAAKEKENKKVDKKNFTNENKWVIMNFVPRG